MSTKPCNCGATNTPALQHALECPLRVEFFGGNIDWDRRPAVHIEPDGTRWVFNQIVGAWKMEDDRVL